MLDTNAIETLAVSAVCDRVVLSPCLDEHINKKDKEPSIDGFVNLYKPGGKGKTKENFYGRVAVQVKGSQKNISQKGNSVKFKVEVSDLKFYQKDGGVIFFFVWISSDGKQRRIFYNDLLPIKIYRILANVRGQLTKSLKFKELTDNIDIKRLFFAFYDEKKKQNNNLIDLPQLPSIDELQKQNILCGLTVSVLNVEGYRNYDQAFLNNDIYIYGNIKGFPFPIPLDFISDASEKAVVREVYNSSISAGDVVYEKGKVIEKLNETVINIEDWFTMTFFKGAANREKRVDFKFTPRKTLIERVKDMAFLLAFLDSGGFYIGNVFCNFKVNATSIKEKDFDVESSREQIIFMKKVLQLFTILHVNNNLDMTTLRENEFQELNTLVLAFVDKEPINYLRADLPFNYNVKIGNIVLALYYYEKDGNKFIGDVFDADLTISFDIDGKKLFVPIYATFGAEEWDRISNIDFKSVLPTFIHFYERYGDLVLFEVANKTLLSILLAFDRNQKSQLLELSIELSKWIFDESPSERLGKELSLINHLQAMARNQNLEKNDLQKLLLIAENTDVERSIRIGAYLLLGNQVAAEIHFNNLDEETKQAFKNWPIYHFWTDTLQVDSAYFPIE